MANSVDNKVVSMKFDNADFQNKIGPTLQGLDRLKQGLNLNEQAKSLDGLSQAGKRFNLDGIGQAVESINSKFSAMGAIGFSVINKLTDMAITAGQKIASAFSLNSAMEGYREFETQIGAIQTILANTQSKGSTLDDVTASLDDLNKYADQTIYNFTEMTRNIGTFTAAGVDLDTSVGAIKGFANAAALAGANSTDTARAMYQLSQGLSAGTFRLIDWMSLETAGVATEEFKKALMDTARVHGVNIDEMIKKNGSFRYTLQEDWLTAGIMTETLSKFTGDLSDEQLKQMGYTEEQVKRIQTLAQTAKDSATKVKTFTQFMGVLKEALGSGWAQSFRLIIGDFEQSKALFTGLADIFTGPNGIITKSSESRNMLLAQWQFLGGREDVIQSLRNVMWSLFSVLDAVKKGFREVFPEMTAWRLADITRGLKDFTEKLKPTQDTLEKIKRIFQGFFSVLSVGWTAIKTVVGAITSLFGAVELFKNAPGGILEFFAKIGDGASKLQSIVGDGSSIKQFLDKYIKTIADFLNGITEKLKPIIDNIGETFNKVKEYITGLFSKDVGSGITEFTDKLGESTNRLEQRWDQLKESGGKLQEFFEKFKVGMERVKDEFRKIFDKLAEAFGQGDFDKVNDAINVGLLGGLLYYFRKFVNDGIKIDFSSFSKLIDSVTESLGVLQQRVKSEIIKNIAIALAILTASILVLSLIDSAALSKALAALGAFFASLVAAMAALDKVLTGFTSAGKMAVISFGLVALSISVIGFAAAVAVLAKIDPAGLVRGGIALTVIFAAISIFLNNMDSPKRMFEIGLGLIGVAAAVFIMAKAIDTLSKIDLGNLAKGGVAFTVLMAIITIFLEAAPEKKMIATGLGLLVVAGSMFFFAKVIERLAEIPFGDLAEGLFGLWGMMAILARSLRWFPKDMPSLGLGLFLISRALSKMVSVVKQFGELDFGTLAKGLFSVTYVLGTLAGALKLMEGSLSGGFSLVLAAGAMFLMYNVVKLFAELGLGSIIVGLIGFAGAITVIAVASLLLAEAIPFMYALGSAMISIVASFTLFGLGILAIGAGIYLLVEGIKTLSEVGREGVKVFAENIPLIATSAGRAVANFVIELINNFPRLLEALSGIIESLRLYLIENAPKFAEMLKIVIDLIIQVIRENYPNIQRVGYEMLIEFLKGLRANIYEITILVSEIITEFMNALSTRIEPLVAAGYELLSKFIQGVADNVWKIYAVGGYLIDQLAAGARFLIYKLIDVGGDMIIAFIDGMGRKAQEIVDAGANAIILFGFGIVNNAVKLADSAFSMLTTFLNELAGVIDRRAPELQEAGGNITRAIIDGITGGMATKAGEVWNAFRDMAKSALGVFASVLGIESPSKEFYKLATYAVAGIANGIKDDTSVINGIENLGNSAFAKLSETLSQRANLDTLMGDSSPTITPVLDLTNVKRGMRDINKLVNTPTIDTAVSLDQASSLSAATRRLESIKVDDTALAPSAANKEIKFEQNIYAPESLNESELYRQTRSQLALAKESLEELTNERD